MFTHWTYPESLWVLGTSLTAVTAGHWHMVPEEQTEPVFLGTFMIQTKNPLLGQLDITFLGSSKWSQQQQQKYVPANSKALDTQSQ